MASVFIQPNYMVIAKDLVLVIEVLFFEKNRCFFELTPQFCFTNAFYLSLQTFAFELFELFELFMHVHETCD